MRIITGSARGRKLKTLPGLNTRPTADKIKGAIFNVLGAKILGSKILDLFAGSGALALEALSRGADSAVLVENSPQACRVIAENIVLTAFNDKTRLLKRNAFSALRDLVGERFDIIFVDPPYRRGLALASLEILADKNYLTPDAVIIAETSREEEIPVEIGIINLHKRVVYGDTTIWYYQPAETGGSR
ncbi:MAG TPA: 16S rRNA (guanine(966)-N(2))-methyltransferase RsmD [Desulfobacteria bacterium]|nr:16S rRNA (guanine(966)-N(2))-methyltransferase RsmD [Desulfobacteria bacterium]